MSVNREDECDSEKFAELLQEAVIKVKTQEDPVLLNQLKKTFKKNVPFTLRMYVAAYLAKKMTSSGSSYRNRSRVQPRTRKFGDDEPRVPRITIDESLAATIFIGIGRNRRVFPRDLVALISTAADIARERIGDIRVLDNYSFVQLFSDDAAQAIERLDGYDYRGRKLAVSYSRKKDENDDLSETDFDGNDAYYSDETAEETLSEKNTPQST